ncbi:hypothetical protein Acr_20g0009710 [Actinidia rufa]|uniref:Aminotransferase-like plant mobile domain-containing protein n=1 Tax=Actinidia rufa TaxID=165716 RepID=A0A7J0GEC7_9ERIC|nr:hypothetical protein Acr_20g0009710 [Actinidia rufa]
MLSPSVSVQNRKPLRLPPPPLSSLTYSLSHSPFTPTSEPLTPPPPRFILEAHYRTCIMLLQVEMTWQCLYTDDIIIASVPACYKASDLWLAQIPLHCFDIVEIHYPDRVMQQFGISQHIPDYVYYFLWETRKVASTPREGVDEMGRVRANTTLDLCRRGLQEAGEVEHLDAALVEDEIVLQEWGQIFRDAGPSTSVSSTSMSWDNGSAPGPSLIRSGRDPSTTAPSQSTRWDNW